MIVGCDVTFKFLDPKKIAYLLQELPEGSVVSPNGVGNLAIYSRDGDEFTFIGYVDFLNDGAIEYS